MNIAKADARLNEKSNLRFLQIANSDKPIALYSLDMILAVGFRVRDVRISLTFRFYSFP
ncbi:hypothetical protein [uncultured Dialister sp.]|uniref:hypothetical protein n=1 Tax=uncultured Dialister sp. TaxID=278064 RepID=UPI0027DB401D|nr:hypothetical protein [uncultured Dialister sp.]